MIDYSYKNWNAMSDKALAKHIGAYIKHHRLEQNKSQDVLSKEAGISRSTLSLLERGETVTVATLLQVIRVLDKLYLLNAFTVEPSIGPLVMARQEKYKRKRARSKKEESKPKYKSDW